MQQINEPLNVATSRWCPPIRCCAAAAAAHRSGTASPGLADTDTHGPSSQRLPGRRRAALAPWMAGAADHKSRSSLRRARREVDLGSFGGEQKYGSLSSRQTFNQLLESSVGIPDTLCSTSKRTVDRCPPAPASTVYSLYCYLLFKPLCLSFSDRTSFPFLPPARSWIYIL